MSRDDYKHVYLDSTSHPIAVPPHVYKQIATIVEAHRICTYCLKGYTPTNPQVAENVCLACFTKHRTNSPTNLIFVGEVPSAYAAQYGYAIYKFVDEQGYVYITNSHNKLNDRIDQDIKATLLHYGYRVPDRYTTKSGKDVDLNAHSWLSIYGDFQKSPVVLAVYHEYYGDQIATAFLLYRDREPLEFSKTKNPTRVWYRETKAEIEATKLPNGAYVVGTGQDGEDRTAYQIYDHYLYPGIVARACSAYNQSKKEHV